MIVAGNHERHIRPNLGDEPISGVVGESFSFSHPAIARTFRPSHVDGSTAIEARVVEVVRSADLDTVRKGVDVGFADVRHGGGGREGEVAELDEDETGRRWRGTVCVGGGIGRIVRGRAVGESGVGRDRGIRGLRVASKETCQ
nr:hypothetical protein CFP56_48704 [Quercus suber]